MRTFFAQRDFYSNPVFTKVDRIPGGVRIAFRIPRWFLKVVRVSPEVSILRSDIAEVYRCGAFQRRALLRPKPEIQIAPMMVSWSLISFLELEAQARAAPTRWCWKIVRDADPVRAAGNECQT